MYDEIIGSNWGHYFLFARMSDKEGYRRVEHGKDQTNLYHPNEAQKVVDFLLDKGYEVRQINQERYGGNLNIEDEPIDLDWLMTVSQEWPMDCFPPGQLGE